MDLIKKHYDRVIIIVAALALILSAALVILNTQAFQEVFSNRNSPKPPDHSITPPPVDIIEIAREQISKPRTWQGHEGSLLISRPYVLKEGVLVDPLDSDTPLHPPVPNAWLMKNNLDYADPYILDADVDNDGFSVLEEWKGNTDPQDPQSKPPYYTKLRLNEFKKIPFRMRFRGTPDEGSTFAVETIDRRQPTQFLAIGDKISGTPFVLKEYKKKEVDQDGFMKDVSELTILNEETNETIVMVLDQVADSPASFAIFVNLLDGKQFEVKKDEDFALDQDPERKYKLIDISEAKAVIQAVPSGDKFEIPKQER